MTPAGKTTQREQAVRIEHTVKVDRPAAELYRFWRDLPNLADVFQHGLVVTAKSRRESHWQLRALGRELEWDADITADEPDQEIGWRSRPGAPVANSGSVRFEPRSDRSTDVTLALEYEPPGGTAGAWLAKLASKEAGRQVEEALRRFKAHAEAVE